MLKDINKVPALCQILGLNIVNGLTMGIKYGILRHIAERRSMQNNIAETRNMDATPSDSQDEIGPEIRATLKRGRLIAEADALVNCRSLGEFKHKVKTILSSTINDYTSARHTFRYVIQKADSNRLLSAADRAELTKFLNRFRAAMDNTAPSRWDELLDRAFRRRNPKFDVPFRKN